MRWMLLRGDVLCLLAHLHVHITFQHFRLKLSGHSDRHASALKGVLSSNFGQCSFHNQVTPHMSLQA